MMEGSVQGSGRDARGRFVPGQSGNLAGKLPGTRNRATLLKAAPESEEGPAMARIVIDKALAGDVVTARFCLDRLEPRPRGRAIAIDLPEGARARDVVAAFDATVQAMASGEITPDEAVQVTRVLDGRRKAIEAAWRESRMDQSNKMEPSPLAAGQLHLTEAPISPRPIGERPFDKRSGGPAPQAREGEGDAQLSRCFLKQTRRRKLPLPIADALGPLLPPRGEDARHGVPTCVSPSPRRYRAS